MEMGMIQKRIELLEKYQEETKNAKEMIKGELENSDEYLKIVEESQEAAKRKKQLKDEILALGPNQKLLSTIKSNNEEIGTLKEILSAELMQIYEQEKTDEVTDVNGEPRKFKVTVKLLPKKGKYQSRDQFGKYLSEE